MRRAIAVFLLSCGMAWAADPDVRGLFERARMLAENNQDLKEAIRLYTQVVSVAKSQRTLAAQAQYRLGLIYDRLGRSAEARAAYRAVVRDFPDQKEVLALARAKLPAVPPQPGVRRVWTPACFFGTASPDGNLISFTVCASGDPPARGNLAVYDWEAQEERRITNKNKPSEMLIPRLLPSVFSRDGKRLAYGWTDGSVDEVRIIKLDGSGQRTLFRAPAGTVLFSINDWSDDGKYVLATLGQRQGMLPFQLTTISVADGSSHAIPTPGQWRGGPVLFSPDGHYVVYSIHQTGDKPRQDIHSISIANGTDTPVVENPANDFVLGWSPGGGTLLFCSDRSGKPAVWAVSVSNGRAQAPPELLYKELNVSRPLRVTNDGSLFYVPYRQVIAGFEVYLAELDPGSWRATSGPKPVSQRFENAKKNQAWSPDGAELVYVSPQDLVFHSMATGKERDLPFPPGFVSVLQWSPDGNSLFILGSIEGASGMLEMDARTGQTRMVAKDVKGEPAFSADGKTLYHSDQQGHLVSRDLATGAVKILYTAADPGAIDSPSIGRSPDGKMLAFRLTGASGNSPSSLVVMPASGGEPRTLFTFPRPEIWGVGGLVWTPDMRCVLAVKFLHGQSTLWKIPLDGSPPEQAGLAMSGVIRRLRLHPDGRQVSFVHIGDPPTEEVWVLDHFLPVPTRRARK